ncbi:polysialyltransferase family glycosyltransferase [Lewinella sp. LCG006]|uniref:polysialyltransferase family glycosyltransferase n=1 Tax=Lewinella sp. LCG006 TaxID=3231911 RepID=UPI0034617220
MSTKISAIVHTEYHLLLFINYYLQNPDLEYTLYLLQPEDRRFKQELNFEELKNLCIGYLPPLSKAIYITPAEEEFVVKITHEKPDIFIFFQEMNLLSVIISSKLKEKGSKVFLFQDGTKAYFELKKFSFGLFKDNFRRRMFLLMNKVIKFKIYDYFNYYRYANYDFIDAIFLTNPEMYDNWNNKQIYKIKFTNLDDLRVALQNIFNWDSRILPVSQNVIFYMTQPLHNDGNAEYEMLTDIASRYSNTLYIKPHPLTNKKLLERYQSDSRFNVIDSSIPAELFLLNLSDSVVLSVNSTSQLIEYPTLKSYYVYQYLIGKIARLKKLNFKAVPAKYIKVVTDINEITF